MAYRFFLWCAGSDSEILNNCTKAERIKHAGIGSLVLIPAILAFVSMSFALSTLKVLENMPALYLLGGLIWGLIIFAFDRFIVSTHRRKKTNQEELKNPAFYLRFVFSLILGIVISHPLVLFYFTGSIDEQIQRNIESKKTEIEQVYAQKIISLEKKLVANDSLYLEKLKERNEQAKIVAMEIDGEVLNKKNSKLTTGIPGKGPSADYKIQHLEKLQSELDLIKEENKISKNQLEKRKDSLIEASTEAIAAASWAKDYLGREIALSQLKEENSIVIITEKLLLLLFILVDLLPFIFKTFAPFGLYDKILDDDAELVKKLNPDSRRIYLQKQYEKLSQV